MKLTRVTQENCARLYEYWPLMADGIPYAFEMDPEVFESCLFSDTREGEPMFTTLEAWMAEDGGKLLGFVQYGLPRYRPNARGERDYRAVIGDIRLFHFFPGCETAGALLLGKAQAFFASRGLSEVYAFHPGFGLSAWGGQGMLHARHGAVGRFLLEHGFHCDQESAWYTRDLSVELTPPEGGPSIFLKPHPRRAGALQYIRLFRDYQEIGGCEVQYLEGPHVVWLNWIWIREQFSRQGLGLACMEKLCDIFVQLGYWRMDAQAPLSNRLGQHYYSRCGFVNMGRMMSFRMDER